MTLSTHSSPLYHWKKRTGFRVGLILLILVSVLPSAAEASARTNVFVIPVAEEVQPAMTAFLKRAIRDASQDTGPRLFIFEFDTFGGRVDAALDIVDLILEASAKGQTVAFVTRKAISAGALIALSCNTLYMKPHTTIGDCAPITYSQEGPKMMGEKFQSPLRAKFRALAKRNNYPVALAEAMVTDNMEIVKVEFADHTRYMDAMAYGELSAAEKKHVRSKKTIVKKGELLTMDDAEAETLGFSKKTVNSIDGILDQMKIKDYRIIRIDPKWSEALSRFIVTISPLLMIIGLAALYMELKAPGFGAPGIIAILCLGLVFLNQYLVGLADHTELLLIVLGIVLLGIEIFVIPGFGIAGITAFVCIIAGMILAFQGFVIPNPKFPWESALLVTNIIHVLGAVLLAFIISMLTLRYLFPKLSMAKKGPYLSETLSASHADSAETQLVRPGDKGVALTSLRPSGKARIGDRMVDAITEGDFLEKGTPIVVYAIKGNRMIVSKDTSDEG